MAVPRFPSKAGKQSYNAAISRHDRGARLGGDNGRARQPPGDPIVGRASPVVHSLAQSSAGNILRISLSFSGFGGLAMWVSKPAASAWRWSSGCA